MATAVVLRHNDTGVIKTGYFGFSWTTLFFGAFPALFRGDYITFLGAIIIMVVLAIFTLGIGAFVAGLVWAFIYNKYFTTRLLERGYVFAQEDATTMQARAALGIIQPAVVTPG